MADKETGRKRPFIQGPRGTESCSKTQDVRKVKVSHIKCAQKILYTFAISLTMVNVFIIS